MCVFSAIMGTLAMEVFNFCCCEVCFFLSLFQTNETGTFSLGQDKKRTSAIFRSVNELVCPLPSGQSTGSYLITITNDNTLFSSAATLIVYDSRCFDCFASNSSCVQKVSEGHIQNC